MKKKTTAEFITQASIIHDNKYEYTTTKYINSRTKVEVVCPKHGAFAQEANAHLSGQGCPGCRYTKMAATRSRSTEEFLEEAVKVHGDTYDYSNTEYVRLADKVTITCPVHGEFEQVAGSHLLGHGCRKCNASNNSTWSYSKWEEAGLISKHFDSFKVYIVRLSNNEESFLKVGKTYKKISQRLIPSILPYDYEVIKIVEGSARNMSELEEYIKRDNKITKYTPDIKFGGCTECYSALTIGKEVIYG